MKFLISNKEQLREHYPKNMGLLYHTKKNIHYLYDEDQNFLNVGSTDFFFQGYLRDLDKDVRDIDGQNESVINEIWGNWPLPENITGSFSAVLLNAEQQKITLCTDQIGLYPLYYLVKEGSWFISNSIILIGAVSGVAYDESGIVQRSLGPEFANLGSRTILKGCKRLLPGEHLQWNLEGNLLQKQYDNRLYQQMTGPAQKHSLTKEYWQAYKKEVEYCVNYSSKVNIALSGGIDSRITLGAISAEKEISCFTYGAPDNYESLIAKKLSQIKKTKFQSCSKPEMYFPLPEIFRKYVMETEALELCSWLEITETVGEKVKEPLLLGELCEALPARNIKKFSSREFRKKNFLSYYVRGKDYNFTKADKTQFENWKSKIIHGFKIYYHERNLQKFNFQVKREELLDELMVNLEELFSRIEAHNLPYAELYDELFSWYTYTRMHLSKHLLTAGSKFEAYSPAMSLQMLTKTSRLHPNIRLNYRFAKDLFRNNKDLKQLNKVPTAQAPLIPQNYPDLAKFSMWGIRSMADQYLINRMMKRKDIQQRYRLFKSMNWAKIYHQPEMESNLQEYFAPNHIGSLFFEELYKQAVERKELKQWPFANLNIINAAALNVEIDLIEGLKDQK